MSPEHEWPPRKPLDQIDDEWVLRKMLLTQGFNQDAVTRRLLDVQERNDKRRRSETEHVHEAKLAHRERERARSAGKAASAAASKVGPLAGALAAVGVVWQGYCALDDRGLIPSDLSGLPEWGWIVMALGAGLFIVAFAWHYLTGGRG